MLWYPNILLLRYTWTTKVYTNIDFLGYSAIVRGLSSVFYLPLGPGSPELKSFGLIRISMGGGNRRGDQKVALETCMGALGFSSIQNLPNSKHSKAV